MSTSKRFFFQILLWLTVWIILSLGQVGNRRLFIENLLMFSFQVFLIAGLIFYLAEKFLFKKKYVLFLVISISAIGICTFISSNLFTPPRMPPVEEFRRLPRRPPSKFLITLLFLTISYVIATFIETFLFAQKKEEETIRSKNENLQTELKLLKSQINPHFLFNSLNNIYALSVMDSDKTQQSISYLSNMLRYVLYECERPLVPLEKEITYIENYIKLFSLKSSKSYPIKTNFNVSDNNLMIAPMLFIPFIENAFKHSNIEKNNGSYIHIRINVTSQNIVFQIENSIPKEKIQKDNVGGIGLENVKKRLSILYPESHQLEINESKEIFEIMLNIKFIDNV
ncbi:sensor histidine kinase [uncultured Aquimarina sp.]|uniref:sensor histidine kinase n=1 Tax=uncultured Aquimarina sp. TaxID=575652 RepID=UPI002630F921|nr:histidine kinase [uncultured Aquimarina sp.]